MFSQLYKQEIYFFKFPFTINNMQNHNLLVQHKLMKFINIINNKNNMNQKDKLKLIISGESPKEKEPSNRYALQPEGTSQIESILKEKYRTFTKWNYKSSLRTTKRKFLSPKKSNDSILNNASYKVNLSSLNTKKQEQSQNNVVGELEGVKSERRERFKKFKFPMQFIKHYMEKENFKPTEEQKELIEKVIAIQKWIDNIENIQLDKVLQKLYKLMNLAVDFNELQFLALLVILTADVCLFYRDMPRSFFFYNQARLAASYSHLNRLKMQSLIGMGMVAFEIQEYDISMRIFKKGLQYAWKVGNEEAELHIYDMFGKALFYEGKIKESKYYHTRYSQSEVERQDSALKKISSEMLEEYNRYVSSLEDQDLNSLFIEYLDLPITNFQHCEFKKKEQKVFKNYQNGDSPRSKRSHKDFSSPTFFDVKTQINKFLKLDYEFATEIPFPDSHQNFLSIKKFGKGNSIDFQHSIDFNRIVGVKHQKPDLKKVLKLPIEKQIEQKMKDKLEPFWWEEMVAEVKKKRKQKVGTLKERVRNSHMSYQKYPMERKKSNVWSSEKINESFNRVLLDWIDPVK